jgi:hypothetical protein
MKSKFLKLNTRDYINGIIVAVFCSFLTGFYQIIANGGVLNWTTLKPVVIAAIGSGIAYLTKNLLTNSKGQFMKGEK